MEVGAGYPVTLVFRPEKQGLSASEMDDYVLAVNAQLGASNLDITTESAQLQVLTDAQYSLVWRWMVQPRSTGERELELDVNLSWTPAVAGLAPVRTEPGTWQQSRTVRVNPSFAYWPLMRTVRVALMGVGLLFWLGWLVLHQRRRKSGSL